MHRALLVAVALALFQDNTETKPVDHVSIRTVEGPLLIWRPAQVDAVPVAEEAKAAPVDRVGTRGGQLAILMAGSGSMITLKGVKVGKDAGLAFEKIDSRLVMKVYDGKVAVDAFSAEFTVQTPSGSIEGGSSYFLIEVSEKATKVVVLDGKLRFTDSQGGVTTVMSGEQIVAEAGKKAAAPKKADPNEGAWAAPATNLVKNGGFEDDRRGWEFYETGPQPNTVIFDKKVFNSGTRSLAFPATLETLLPNPDMMLFWQTCAVTPKKRYMLRAYLRTELTKGNLQPGLLVEPVVNGVGARSFEQSFTTSGPEWKMARVFIVPKEAKLKVAGTMTAIGAEFNGKIWFDDITLVEVPEITEKR